MLNIFNLFLFLFAIWIILMVGSDKLSFLYVFLGFLASLVISIVSFKLGLVERKSELLYLSIGFYSHFIGLYLKNFYSSLKLVAFLALSHDELNAVIKPVSVNYKDRFNPALLMGTINMMSGLFCIGLKQKVFFVHCLDEKFIDKLDFMQVSKKLKDINDDNLV